MYCIVLYCIVLGGLKSKGLPLPKCRYYKSLPCVETNYPRTIDARRYSYGCQSPNSSSRTALFGAILSLKPTGPDTNTLHEGHLKVQNSLNSYPPVESKPQYNIRYFLSLRLKSVSFRGSNNKVRGAKTENCSSWQSALKLKSWKAPARHHNFSPCSHKTSIQAALKKATYVSQYSTCVTVTPASERAGVRRCSLFFETRRWAIEEKHSRTQEIHNAP